VCEGETLLDRGVSENLWGHLHFPVSAFIRDVRMPTPIHAIAFLLGREAQGQHLVQTYAAKKILKTGIRTQAIKQQVRF